MGPRRKMLAVIQRRYTYNTTARRRKATRNTAPQASIHNIRSLDVTGWILQITDKVNAPNNSAWDDKVISGNIKKKYAQ